MDSYHPIMQISLKLEAWHEEVGEWREGEEMAVQGEKI